MEDQLKNGTSTNTPELSETSIKITLSTLQAMVDLTILPSQAPTLTGGNFSDSKDNISLMSKTIRHLMLKEVKTQKVKPYGPGEDTMVSTRDGKLYILTKRTREEQRE
jgi:hypothetical protein